MKLCHQTLTPDGWRCDDCGAGPYKVRCRRNCGTLPPGQPQTCPECGEALVRKQRLPEGKWYWRCPECRVDRGECRSCNDQPSSKGSSK